MFENIRLAFQGIWSHKMRSFLTMLGIIIGIASIISIVSTIRGTSEMLKQNLIGAGNNAVTVNLNDGDSVYDVAWGDTSKKTPILTDEIKEKVKNLDNVENASFFYSRTYADGIYYDDSSLQGGKIYGVDSEYLNTCGYIIQNGRGFVDKDFSEYRKVVLLDNNAVNSMFGEENPLGKTIEIKGEPFTVVGVYTNSSTYEPTINSIEDYYTYNQDMSGTVLIPNSSWPIIYKYDEPENAVVRAKNTDAMSKVGQKTAETLNAAITDSNSKLKYKAVDLLERAQQQQELSESTNRQLIWIASIALLVGGIGVMNIMLVSVTERTSEIGLKKAIGARKNRILFQFLTEAAVLTSLGGVIGVIVGLILSKIISKVASIPVAISVPAIVISVVFSMVIGIVFGLLPSVKAANLNPIDALRRE
ncbi:MAG: ABC transporter permease [Lachnospiraceae bacterium]|nr:ABC transporter permease [Lachnospiraceae bacterium]MDD6618917.1 ABC transporter permease [Clostridiales bacterium]MDY4771281.1 ABC transporter permease [Lachnospiraceae bacterium]